MSNYDRESVYGESSPEGGIPDGAIAPPDAVAACYSAAASTIDGGSHAARTGYYSTPVDDAAVMLERVAALEDAASSLMIGLAILRDATGGALPEHTDAMQALVHQVGDASDGLRDLRRRLGGTWDMTPDDDDD